MKNILFVLLFPFLCFSQETFNDIEALFKQKQFKMAEGKIAYFLKNNPNDLAAIELLGDVYGHQKKWDSAVNVFKKLVDKNPKKANYHYKYGGVLGMKALENKLKALGFIGDIKKAFTTAAELDENHIDARWALVELYMQLPMIIGGSKSKSLKYAEELEQLSKVDGYLAKGYVHEYDDAPELAEKYYKMAIKEGGSLTCFDKLTKHYEKQHQPEKAIKTLEEAQAKHKRNALHYQIGKVAAEYNVELKKGAQCLQVYLKNHSASDGVPKAWANYRLAQIYGNQQNKETALKFINLAIQELPEIKTFKEEKERILSL